VCAQSGTPASSSQPKCLKSSVIDVDDEEELGSDDNEQPKPGMTFVNIPDKL